MLRLIFAAAVVLISSSAAFAQSPCQYIASGAVLTAAQWQLCFQQKADAVSGGFLPLNGGVMLGKLILKPSTTTAAGINVQPGVAPSSPINGDFWSTSSGFFGQVNGVTVGPFANATSSGFAKTNPISLSFPSGVVTYGLNYDTNFSLSGSALALANCSANTVLAGPTSGSAAEPGCRSLIGSDLPFPGASSLGGVESYSSPSHQWINALSTGGVLSSAQPAFSDLSGSISPTQCVAALAATLGCVELNGTTLSVNGSGGLSVNLSNANTWGATQTFPANSITLGEIVQDSTGYSLLGNTSSGSANYAPFAIGSLTQKVSPVAGDEIMIADSAAGGALKYALVSAIASAGSVSSIDAKTGSFTTGNGLDSTVGNLIELTSARRTLPTHQIFLSGSGTYTTPANVLWIDITLIGGGAGGGGGGTLAMLLPHVAE